MAADGEKIIEVETETEKFRLKGRPCELSAFSFVPTRRPIPKERTVFNSTPGSLMGSTDEETENTHKTYTRLFETLDLDYNGKIHRDDREHAKSRGLNVHAEESSKVVPTLASSEYGHRLDQFVDPPGRKYVRVGIVKAEFYRNNGVLS